MKDLDIDETTKRILSLDMVDPEIWITNFIEASTHRIIDQLSKSEGWMEIVKSAVEAGEDLKDKKAMVLHGIDAGVIKTAAQKQAEFEVQQKSGFPELNTQESS